MSKLHQVLATALLCTAGVSTYADGYLSDGQGEPVRNAYNQCWRTGSWSPAHASRECDPDLISAPEVTVGEVIVILVLDEPVAQPAAAPAMPMPPVAKTRQRTSVEVDALFDFDSAELRSMGHAKLDGMAKTILAATSVEAIKVVGHSDRLGSSAYNHSLSLRRAEAVKAALVSKGVKAEWIWVDGKGEDMPLTGMADCSGKATSAKLIACLQPDRRVELEAVLHAVPTEAPQGMHSATSY